MVKSEPIVGNIQKEENNENLTLGAEYLKKKFETKTPLTERQKEIRKYCTKMYRLQKQKNGDGAINVLDNMRILKVENDEAIYNHAINVLVRGKMIDKANEIAKKMKEENFKINQSLLAFLINGQKYSIPPKEKEAEEYFKELEQNYGLTETGVASLMNVYCRTRNEEGLLKLFEKVKGSELPLKESIYAPLIKFYSNKKQVEKCEELLEEMKENMIPFSRNVYSMLIQSCRMPEQKEKSIQLFEEMKDQGVRRDAIVYQVIIKQMILAKDFELVYEFYERMKIAKVKPQKQLLYHLLDTCVKDNLNVTKARRIIKEMKSFGGFTKHDAKSISYITLMRDTIRQRKRIFKETVKRSIRKEKERVLLEKKQQKLENRK
eukprot:gene1892-1033_t